ncbi:hypothetical protein HK099_003212, partial [Clydaea vesicula]
EKKFEITTLDFKKNLGLISKQERALLETKLDKKNLIQLGENLRLFKKYFDAKLLIKEEKKDSKFNEFNVIYSKLENKLFSWFLKKNNNSNFISLHQSFREKGIVMCIGDKGYPHLAYTTIMMVREVFNCDLPFELFYLGESDLSLKNKKKFESIVGVTLINLETMLDNNILKLKGYDMKPFACLFSSFKEVLLMDSDTVFLKSPLTFFLQSNYIKTGTLFFHDRQVKDFHFGIFKTSNFIKSYLPKTIPKAVLNLNILNWKTDHEQESGVVLIDKSKHLVGLLASCSLFQEGYRDILYYYTPGDKETF